MTAASWPLDVALVAAVEADAPLAAMLAGDKVYSGEIPQGSPLDYIQLTTSNEGAVGHAFHVEATAGEHELHLWTADTSRQTVLAIFAHLERILRRLPLDDHVVLSGRARLVAVMLDRDRAAIHGVVRYAWRTRTIA